MHFDLIFRSSNDESYETNLSYGLVFIPTPCWAKCGDVVLENPCWSDTYHGPEYRKGAVGKLIQIENLTQFLKTDLEAVIVVRNIGHASDKDLNTLKEDLIDEGFKVTVYGKNKV